MLRLLLVGGQPLGSLSCVSESFFSFDYLSFFTFWFFLTRQTLAFRRIGGLDERGEQHAPDRHRQNAEGQLKRGREAIDQGGHRNPKAPVGYQNGQDGDNVQLFEMGQLFDRAPEGEVFGLPKEGERLERVA